MLFNCYLVTSITMTKMLLTLILLTFCTIKSHTCYTIMELSHGDSGSGQARTETSEETVITTRREDSDSVNPKSHRNSLHWNGIEPSITDKPVGGVISGGDKGAFDSNPGMVGDDSRDTIKTVVSGDQSIFSSSAASISSATKDSDSDSSPLLSLQQLNPGLKFFMWKPTTEPESNESKQKLKECTSNDDCVNAETCNLYSRKCERCRIRNEICRRDGNCCNGMKCLWGRCRSPRTNGTESSLCQTSRDCQPGLCCAKEHGLSICKRFLKQDATCELPLGGLVFSLHHSCPCEEGLHCQMDRRLSDYPSIKGKCIK